MMKTKANTVLIGAFLVLILMTITACNSTNGASGDTVEVELKNMAYHPDTIEISPGTTVRWVNHDTVDHSVWAGTPEDVLENGEEPLFKSENFATDESFEYTFEEPGEYPYFCNTASHYQLGMVGTITVTR